MTDLTKAIELAEKASEQLQKSHVKQYTRSDGTVVKEHDDKRIKTNNEGYGYHGEAWRPARNHGAGQNASAIADEHFDEAAKHVMKHGKVGAEDARNYLDSAYGRHLHDEVSGRAWKKEPRPADEDKGHHPDVIKQHIGPAIKEHFERKSSHKALAEVVKNRENFN